MSEKKQNKTIVQRGIISSTGLTILFVALKLLGVIDWSWEWVTSPTWIPIGIVIIMFAFCIIVPLIAIVLTFLLDFISDWLKDKKNVKVGKKIRKEYIDKGILVKKEDGTYGVNKDN